MYTWNTLLIEHFDTKVSLLFSSSGIIANDTLPTEYPYLEITQSLAIIGIIIKYKTHPIYQLKDTIRKSELVGTYKCRWELENSDCLVTSDATMKLNADGTFELIDEWVSWDISGTVFPYRELGD